MSHDFRDVSTRSRYHYTFYMPNLGMQLFMIIFLSAQAPQPAPNLPDAQATLQYLRDAIDWYHNLHIEEQLATDPTDAMFLEDNRQLARQIVRLSFDFARAQAKLLSNRAMPAAAETQSPEVARYSGLSKAAAQADQEVKETETELESLKQKLQTAQGEKRRELQSTIDEVQAELNLDRTRSETFKNILQFVGEAGANGTNLQAQIDELARSIPEVEVDTTKSPAAAAPAAAPASRNQQPSGILDLITSLFALNRKINALDQAVQSTDVLTKESQQLRQPLLKSMIGLIQRGDQLAKEADTSVPAQLAQEKRELDALTARFKEMSTVIVPIGRQSILFGLYKAGLNRWKSAVQSQYSLELRSLIVRAVVLGIALAVVFVLAEIWRKATLRYVRDIRRRYQFLLLRRIVMWCAIGITVAFALATEIGSLATFAGLITAGIAVALQNVILAIAGYFFLVGKYGVRVGDRVQISGVTGTVVDIGLIRLHLMELAGAGSDRQPTGRVVVFSNSIVFQPTASFFKQIPGTNFGWHEVTLILSPDTDYHAAEQRMLDAVQGVYAKYRDKIEEQHRHMEQAFTLGLEVPQPRTRLRLTQTGLEVVIRYPLELERSAEIDDQIIRELLAALEKPPKLKLVGSGTPNIQPVLDGNTAA
jgi:small-conductance mechanosensitive channel